MALTKQEFAELIEKAIEECKHISSESRKVTERLYMEFETNSSKQPLEENPEYKYNKYMERLAMSKMSKLYAVLANPAYDRILAMTNEEIEEYRMEKISEITVEVNRLVLDFGNTKTDMDRVINKERVELLLAEQRKLKDMDASEFKRYMVAKLELDDAKKVENDILYASGEEATVLANISKDKETLSKFFSLIREYRSLEREIKSIKSEQLIIYKNVLPENLSLDYLSENIEDLFSDDALAKLQSVISDYLQSIVDIEGCLQVDFGEESKKAYLNIKSTNYKYKEASSEGKLPYNENDLKILKDKIPARIYELALLQNKEWQSLGKKLFKSSEVRTRIGQLSLEIDETKSEIDTHVREWYRLNYYDNPAFESISSRNSGKLEYSLGAKECLCEFMAYGVWPREEDVESLNICLKLNKNEAERSVIQAEQIKERFTRIYTGVLEDKKKKQSKVEKELTKLVGNWKNPIILSIIDGVKDTTKPSDIENVEGLVAEEVGEYSAKELVSELVNHNDEVLEVEEDKKK